MDDNCVFIFCSVSSETAVNATGGYFNQAVFAVYVLDFCVVSFPD